MWPFCKKQTRREREAEQREAHKKERARRLKQSISRQNWHHFLGYLGHYTKVILWIVLLIIVGGFLEIILPQLVRFVIDDIVPARDFVLLNIVILSGFVLYLIHAGVRFLERKKIVTLSLNLIAEIRRDLFDYHVNLPMTFFERQSSGRLISKITYSTMMLKLLVETFAYVSFRELVTISLIVSAAMFIDWRLTMIFLGLTPLFVLYVLRLNRYMREIAKQLQTKNDQILMILNRTYNAIKLHHLFGSASREVTKLDKVLQEDKILRIRRTLVYAGNVILIGLVTSVIILSALWYGGRQMILGELSSGEMTAYIIYIAMLLRPLSEFVRASAYFQAGTVGVASVFSVFERAKPLAEPEMPREPKVRAGAVCFENVSFRYTSGRVGLMHFSFAVQPKKKVLILGPSGSGKSTIFSLMLRLADVEGGRIEIDGVDVRQMTRETLHSLFTVIPQDQLHLEDTLLSNILLDSTEESPGARIDMALELTQKLKIDAKIMSRQKKFGEVVGADGVGLSRGELQKIALLRAAAKDAPIVLMDEPTSSMDLYSERQTFQLVEDIFSEKTVFLISHRAIPAFHADWIVILRNGRMEMQGHHHYLMEHSSFYRQMYRNASNRA